MSAMSEESPLPPTSNPQDPRTTRRAARASASSRGLRRSTKGRSSARAGGETSRTLPASAALSAKLESAVYESLRRQMEPEVVPEPKDYKRLGTRRTLIAIASGVAAALALASVAALLFVTVYPRETGRRPTVRGGSAAGGAIASGRRQVRAVAIPRIGQHQCRRPELHPRAVRTAAAAIRAVATEGRCGQQTLSFSGASQCP